MNNFTVEFKNKLNDYSNKVAKLILNDYKNSLNIEQIKKLNKLITSNNNIDVTNFTRKFDLNVPPKIYRCLLDKDLLTHHISNEKELVLFTNSPYFISKNNQELSNKNIANIVIKHIFNSIIDLNIEHVESFNKFLSTSINDGVIEYYTKEFCNNHNIEYTYTNSDYNLKLASMIIETIPRDIDKSIKDDIVFNGTYVDLLKQTDFGDGLSERLSIDYHKVNYLNLMLEDMINVINLKYDCNIDNVNYYLKNSDIDIKYESIYNAIKYILNNNVDFMNRLNRIYDINEAKSDLTDIDYYKKMVV